jgi:methyl-accepting chemotaxis protein
MSEGDTNAGEVARLAFHDTIKASEENAVDPLVQLLQHPSPRVRREAAIELGDIATPALEGFNESLRGTLSTTGEAVGETLQPVAEKATDVSGQTAEKALEAIDSAKTKVAAAQREKSFGEWVRDTASAVGRRIHLVVEEAEDAGEHVAQASETVEKGKETISEEQRQMRERGTVEAVKEKTGDVARATPPAKEKVIKTTKEGI